MKKWLTYTLGLLVTFIVLATVAGLSYRMGFERGSMPDGRFPLLAGHQEFDRDGTIMRRDIRAGWMDVPVFDARRPGMRFVSPFLWIAGLAAAALLLGLAYTLYKRSGWQFVRVDSASPGQPPPANEK